MTGFLLGLVTFLFGASIGSFLNVVVYRLNQGLSPLQGRSYCPKCRTKIAWYDNVPLLSFFLLKGKCRSCHSPISWQYPLVELATALLTFFVVNYLSFSDPLKLIYYLFITYVLIAIFVSDLRYETIPDKISYPAIGAALVYSLTLGISYLLSGLGAGLFFLLLVLFTRGRGMGVGDIKLAGLMGLVLGWPRIIVALYLAFLTGAVVGGILILIRRKRFGEHIPFGPFLAGATWVSLFWGEQIWQICVEKVLV